MKIPPFTSHWARKKKCKYYRPLRTKILNIFEINTTKNFVLVFSFTLYLRLSVTAGVMWVSIPISIFSNCTYVISSWFFYFSLYILQVMELISFLISPKSPFFLITDLCNTLHGVFIFILFVVKRQMFRLIMERFVLLRLLSKIYF